MVRVLKRESNHHITILSACHKANSAANNYTESKQRRGQNGFVPPQIMETVVFRRSSQQNRALLDSTKSCKHYISKLFLSGLVPHNVASSATWFFLTGNHCSPMFPAFLTANVLQTAGFNIVLLRFGPTQFCKFSPFLEILSPISLTAHLCKFHFVFRMLGSKH